MTTRIGVAELKASLSAYLARVRAGQEVIVTSHGRAIARLVPVETVAEDAEAHLVELERRGLLRRGAGCVGALAGPRPADPEGRMLEALLADREGR